MVVSSAAPITDGDFYGLIVFNADLVIATIAYHDGYNATDADLNGKTLKPGQYPMRIKTLTITSGEALAYRN